VAHRQFKVKLKIIFGDMPYIGGDDQGNIGAAGTETDEHGKKGLFWRDTREADENE